MEDELFKSLESQGFNIDMDPQKSSIEDQHHSSDPSPQSNIDPFIETILRGE